MITNKLKWITWKLIVQSKCCLHEKSSNTETPFKQYLEINRRESFRKALVSHFIGCGAVISPPFFCLRLISDFLHLTHAFCRFWLLTLLLSVLSELEQCPVRQTERFSSTSYLFLTSVDNLYTNTNRELLSQGTAIRRLPWDLPVHPKRPLGERQPSTPKGVVPNWAVGISSSDYHWGECQMSS